MKLSEPKVIDIVMLGVTVLLACATAPSFFHATIALFLYWIGILLSGIEDKLR